MMDSMIWMSLLKIYFYVTLAMAGIGIIAVITFFSDIDDFADLYREVIIGLRAIVFWPLVVLWLVIYVLWVLSQILVKIMVNSNLKINLKIG